MPINDQTLLRYLRARNFDVEKAAKMLEDSISWRKEFGVSGSRDGWGSIIELENSTGKLYVRGYDRQGHAILYMKPRFENTKDHDGNLKHLVYHMERAIACMDKYSKEEKICLVIDYHGFSMLNSPPMKTSMATLNILQNHYPERLFRAYMIRPPWLFHAFWSAISPFVDPITRAKIQMISEKDLAEVLGKDMDLSLIEAEIGGQDDRPFHSSTYLTIPFDVDYWSHLESNQ